MRANFDASFEFRPVKRILTQSRFLRWFARKCGGTGDDRRWAGSGAGRRRWRALAEWKKTCVLGQAKGLRKAGAGGSVSTPFATGVVWIGGTGGHGSEVPVIATNVGGFPKSSTCVDGYLVEPGDVRPRQDAIELLSPRPRARNRAAARVSAKKKFCATTLFPCTKLLRASPRQRYSAKPLDTSVLVTVQPGSIAPNGDRSRRESRVRISESQLPRMDLSSAG